jgi:uncharacterized protein YidB (DUF937 family)
MAPRMRGSAKVEKARALSRIVAPRRFQQTQHAGLDQVVHLHRCRQPGQQVVGDPLDLRRVAGDQVVRRLAAQAGVQGHAFHSPRSLSR